jgi:hypothetical protein
MYSPGGLARQVGCYAGGATERPAGQEVCCAAAQCHRSSMKRWAIGWVGLGVVATAVLSGVGVLEWDERHKAGKPCAA